MKTGGRVPLERVVLGATAARLLLLGPLVAAITASHVAWTAAALVFVVGADVFDGVVARRYGVDSPSRRVFDAVIDRLSIHGASLAVALVEPRFAPVTAVLLVRDVAQGLIAVRVLRLRRRILRGRRWHGASSLANAGLCLAAVARPGSGITCWIAGGTIGINYVVLVDYWRLSCGGPGARGPATLMLSWITRMCHRGSYPPTPPSRAGRRYDTSGTG